MQITEERLVELERQFSSERHSFFRGVLPLQISDDDAELLFSTIRTLRERVIDLEKTEQSFQAVVDNCRNSKSSTCFCGCHMSETMQAKGLQ